MPKRALSIFIVFCFLMTAASGKALAAGDNTDSEKLDIVIVLDASGSMRESDPDRITADAVKMLISMLPANDSRVGIVSFNVEPKVRTKDSKGKDALIGLEQSSDADSIKAAVDRIEYMDDTGIGNAIYKASEMLHALARENSRKAIILFTDGMDDLQGNTAMQKCIENEQKAVTWAKENGCPIYCVGLNFEDSRGSSSLGENGEGIKKLSGIAEPTGGFARSTADIQKIEELFIEMLENIFSIYYNEIEFIPEQGNAYEAEVRIGQNVNEANIRISSTKAHMFENGGIELYDPNGNLIAEEDDGLRFDSEKLSTNIKMFSPKAGKWKLILSGLEGADIKIGLLEHYYFDIESEIKLPDADTDTLYTMDEVTISAYLTSEGEIITDSGIYDAVNAARAHVIPTSDPGSAFDLELIRDGASFTGTFAPKLAGEYEIEISLSTDSFYRIDNLSLVCEDRPVINSFFLVKSFENVELLVNEQIEIENILSYINNEQGGPVDITVSHSKDQSMAKITYDPSLDRLVIEGSAGDETEAFITFSDGYGNKEEASFKIKVNEPVIPEKEPVRLSIGPEAVLSVVAIALIVCILAFNVYRFRRIVIKGYILLHSISLQNAERSVLVEAVYNGFGDIQEDSVFSAGLFSDKKDRNLAGFLLEAAEKFESSANSDKQFIRDFLGSEAGKRMYRAAKKVKLTGTFNGDKGIRFLLPRGNKAVLINKKHSGKFNLDVDSTLEIVLLAEPDKKNGASIIAQLEYKAVMRHWTRSIVTPED